MHLLRANNIIIFDIHKKLIYFLSTKKLKVYVTKFTLHFIIFENLSNALLLEFRGRVASSFDLYFLDRLKQTLPILQRVLVHHH